VALLALAALAIATLTAPSAHAQQRFNFLAVEGALLDAAGPYYFVDQGDSSNAFAKAAPLAAALGLEVDYDADRGLLVFEDAWTRAEWQVTRDVRAGLEHRLGTLRVDGDAFGRPVPSAILVDGVSYVAVTPLAQAFGGDATWFSSARVIEVIVPERDPVVLGRPLDPPRIGRHDGYTRVAIDVPDDQPARLAVADGSVALLLPGARLDATDRALPDGPLTRVYADEVGATPALVLVVDHAVAADGTGYRMGRTAGGVVYVDVGPGLSGEPVEALALATPPQPTAAVPRPLPERRPVVVIDAGHGGHDPGTVSSWAQEKEIVLDVARRVAERLEEAGVEVVLTRDRDVFLTLQERSTFATTERNVFVSIHANAAPSTSAQGIETWVFGRPLDPSLIDRAIRENGGGEVGAQLTAEAAQSADIAGDILRESQLNYSLGLANLVQDRLVAATGANDRGVRQNLFYVIRNSRIPAILVELGFVSNPDEGRMLMRDDYRASLSEALADGVLDFLSVGGNGGDLARAAD
jgi:N-acetylmuramoyl-L-alanine amidase